MRDTPNIVKKLIVVFNIAPVLVVVVVFVRKTSLKYERIDVFPGGFSGISTYEN